MAMASNNSGSPCAACKFLRRRCLAGCIFAPYFPPEEPHKFANVHKIFGASNVAKLLNELLPEQREDAVNSLAYEAEARVKDPVYGCVGAISVLQRQVRSLQKELDAANADLLRYAYNDRILHAGGLPGLIPPPELLPPPGINYQKLPIDQHPGGRTTNTITIGRRNNNNNNSYNNHGDDNVSEAAAGGGGGGRGPLYDQNQVPASSSFMALLPSPPSSTNVLSGYYYSSTNTAAVENTSSKDPNHIKG